MYKKISTLFIIFAIFLGFGFVEVKKIQAQVSDLDDAANIASTGTKFWQVAKEVALVPAVTMIADQLLNKLSGDIINWANGGFEGQPGFVNNWDDFLQGTAHATIGAALNTAMMASERASVNKDIENSSATIDCKNNLYSKYPESEESTEACNARYSQYLNDFEGCIYGLDENDPDYESIYDTCKETRDIASISLDRCVDNVKNFASELAACNKSFNGYDHLGNIAEQNYNLMQSGEAFNSRSVTKTIANYGTRTLNLNPVDSVINGEGNTLKRLLGTQQNVNNFSNDITVGGWGGYIALADPHNYSSGLQSIVTGIVGRESSTAVSKSIQNIQTPVKFLDKKYCVSYRKDAEGNRVKDGSGNAICDKEISGTPGELVSAKLQGALQKDETSAASFSNALVGSLLRAAGRLTDGLISAGFNNLSAAANREFFSPKDNQTFTDAGGSANYQSEYDVLGILNDVSAKTNAEYLSGLSGGGNSIFDTENNYDFIGGPEDQKGWNTGSQVIIDFQKDLEKNIILAEKEAALFAGIKKSIDTYKNTAINMDRCLPGPDYNWEKRYNDRWSSFGSDDETAKNKLGLLETKEMVNDPLVNIPGSLKMRDTFKSLLETSSQETQKTNDRKETVQNVVRTLNGIKDEVKATIPKTTGILFVSDWEKLNITEKKTLGLKAANSLIQENGVSSGNYLLIKTEAGETIDQLLSTNETKVRDAVIAMSWTTWRNQEPTDKKKSLRYRYYLLESDLSTDRFIAEIESNLFRIEKNGAESGKLLNDCLILKAYTLGADITKLKESTRLSGTADSSLKQAGVSTALYTAVPVLGIVDGISKIFGGGGIFGPSGQSLAYIDISKARSNADIKKFLAEQSLLYNDGNPATESLFQTNYLMSDVESSILQFDNTQTETVSVQTTPGTSTETPKFEDRILPQTQAYFQQNYPDYGFKDEIKNSYEMKDIFSKDRFYSGYNRAKGVRGTLYCRNQRVFDAISGTPDSDRSVCIQDWYVSTGLDYEILFAGI